MDVKAYDMRFIKDIGDKAMALLSTMHKGANANGCSIVCYEDHANMKVFNESGHGYFGCLRADGEFNDSNTSHAVCYEVPIEMKCFDAYQHHNWRESDTVGPLTTLSCAFVRGDTPFFCYGVDFRNGTVDKEKTHTIQAKSNGGFSYNCTPSVCYAIQGNMVDRETRQGGDGVAKDVSPTLNTQDKHAVCFAVGGPRNGFYDTEKCRTLDTEGINPACNQGGMVIVYEGQNLSTDTKTAFTIQAGRPDDHHVPGVCYGLSRSFIAGGMNAGGIPINEELSPAMQANGTGAVVYPITTGALCAKMDRGLSGQDGFNDMIPVIRSEDMDGQKKYVLRRLTPLECARLQGFPDWWTDGVEGSDSNKYKMWGNGIALPCAADVIGRIAKEMSKDDCD